MWSKLFGKRDNSRLVFARSTVEAYISILEKISANYEFRGMNYNSIRNVNEIRDMVLGYKSLLNAAAKEINRRVDKNRRDEYGIDVFLSEGNNLKTMGGQSVKFYMIKELYTLSLLNPVYPDDWSQRSVRQKDYWWEHRFLWVIEGKVENVKDIIYKLKCLLGS